MKNYIGYTVLLTGAVFAVLMTAYLLPEITVGEYKLRSVDLLSSVRISDEDTLSVDSLALPEIAPFQDTCKEGITCIEEYSDSTERGMQRFYASIEESDSTASPIRIAVLGDSFIEGDVLTADMRAMLQHQYGGCGVGYVPITSNVSGFRPTVKHSYRGWYSHNVTDTSGFDRRKQNLGGHYFVPSEGAFVELKGTKYLPNLDSCEVSKFYFINRGYMRIVAQMNNGEPLIFEPRSSGEMQSLTLMGRVGSVRWCVEKADSAFCYGVTMEGRRGVVLDNFSVRGSSGIALAGISETLLKSMQRLRPYDLIILCYGLNVATPRGSNYDYYLKGMTRAIENLKSAFPESGFLLLGVGDRNYKTESGEFKTMPGIINLIKYQQQIASDCKIAFWNMYKAMGGEGSMSEMVKAKPSMANYDYTHINFRGGRHIAELLFNSMVYGREQYDRRIKYRKNEK